MEQITITQAAERKECSRQAIHDAIKRGGLDAVQIGNMWVVLVAEKFSKWEPNRKRQEIGRESQRKD